MPTDVTEGQSGPSDAHDLPYGPAEPSDWSTPPKSSGEALDELAASGGITDHGALTGLGDDDHTQYVLLAGRGGGQTLMGGTAAGDDLNLRSTSNATKGQVIVGDAAGNVDISGAGFTTNVKGELAGCRHVIGAGRSGNITASEYLRGFNGLVMSAAVGWPMMRAGSVTGVAACCTVTAETTPGTVTFEVRKNGTAIYSVELTISGTGDYEAHATQARDVDTFAAGDILSMYVNFGTFVGTLYPTQMLAEFVTDS